jgi:hypothetical protein
LITDVVGAVTRSSLHELFDGSQSGHVSTSSESLKQNRAKGTRLRGNINDQKEAVLRAARALAPGFRKSDIMNHVDAPGDYSRALTLLVKEGKLRIEGARSLARYFLPS